MFRVSTSHDQTSPILSSPDDVGNETMNQYIQSPGVHCTHNIIHYMYYSLCC